MKIYAEFVSNLIPANQKTKYSVGSDLLGNLNKIIKTQGKEYTGFLILADKTAFKLFGKKIFASLRKLDKPIIVSQIVATEQNKDIAKIESMVQPFFRYGFNRTSCLITIGGGIVSDIGGFIGSILLRGIDSIYIPTTLLSQVDAAIGGKTGVNYQDLEITYKNMMGTFKQAVAVISDVDTLSALPEKEWTSGLGEIVKYWIGWGKPDIDQILNIKNQNDKKRLAQIIIDCQKIKRDVVQRDPFETSGERQKLNLGHTIGHAIEGAANGKLSHGEAVSIGLSASARLSLSMKLLKFPVFEKIIKSIASLKLPIQTTGVDKQKVLQALKMDKKGGSFVLIEDIGRLKTDVPVKPELIEKLLEEIIV